MTVEGKNRKELNERMKATCEDWLFYGQMPYFKVIR